MKGVGKREEDIHRKIKAQRMRKGGNKVVISNNNMV